MSNLIPYTPRSRAVARQLGRAQSQRNLELHHCINDLDALAEAQAAKARTVGTVTEAALYEAAHVWSAASNLAQAIPHAASGMAQIAMTGTLALDQIVADTGRQVR